MGCRTLLFMVLLGTVGCVQSSASVGSSGAAVTSSPDKSGPTVTSAAQCKTLGGTWRRVGMRQLEACDIPTKDAGKACRDSRDCESVCVAPSGAKAGEPVDGMCYRSYLTVGTCLSEVRDGRIVSAQCSD